MVLEFQFWWRKETKVIQNGISTYNEEKKNYGGTLAFKSSMY